MMGASVNLFFGSDSTDDLSYTGLSIGSIYRLGFKKNIGKGFKINKPQVGLSVNAGIPAGENDEYSNFNQLTLGYSFLFYSAKIYDLSFFNDISAINGYDDFPLKFGIESLIKKNYIVRAGFTAPQSYEYGDYTLGLGYRFRTDYLDGDINYSLVHYSEKNFVHYIGANLRYGELDRIPPETGIESTEKYISPNYDGKKDFLFFKPMVKDDSRITGWKLQILNSRDEVVREYRISERDIEKGLSLKRFFKKVWQKKESMVVPETILWDGIDSNGKGIPDGKYTYSFIAWDERDNISAAKKGIINVDNTSPQVKLTSGVLFSPNGDGHKDKLRITLDVVSSPDDEWMASFLNTRGEPLRSYKWKGSSVPKSVVWDGKDDKGKNAPEGVYSFFILSIDKAGNSASAVKKGISLTREYEVADITCSQEYFSYKLHKNIKFFLNLSKTAGLQNWKISVEDDDGEKLKEISGDKELIKFVQWDVLDSDGEKLDDGKYFFKLSTSFKSGNTPSSFVKELIIDSSSPEVSLSYSPDLFSPDGDGENDILTLNPEASDNTGINDWNLEIYAPSGNPFKSYRGTSSPAKEIKWDGIGKNNELVESAADYFIELAVTDFAGNSSKSERIKLPIDVLVVVTERGLKIRISNIEFAFDRAELTIKAHPILNRVAEILVKYHSYNVMIEGHTDDIGEEEYNLKLSELRAKEVMDYLVSEGIDEERLSFRGMGETTPFLPNKGAESRRRNRRVEFLLLKEKVNESGAKNEGSLF
ncbi:MAG: OmpA family protein [bacterium]|nr:OmpA family protein [bacterium]